MNQITPHISAYLLPVAMILWAIAGMAFYRKNRSFSGFLLAVGCVIVTVAHLIQRFVPAAKMTLDEAANAISSTGIPTTWQVASILTPIGFVIGALGLLLMATSTAKN